MNHLSSRFVRIFLFLFFNFTFHRLLIARTIATHISDPHFSLAPALGVGLMSDAWIAVILSVVFSMIKRLRILLPILSVMCVGLALHVAYVEFFGFSFIVQHLPYLYDLDFINANAATAYSWLGMLSVFFAVAMGVLFLRGKGWEKVPAWLVGALIATGIILHVANIRYRVNWFVPESLQVNVIERIIIDLWNQPHFAGVEAAELEKLSSNGEGPYFEIPMKSTDPFVDSLRQEIDQRQREGRPAIVIAVLLESLRASEMGAHHPDSKLASLTPVMDRMARDGVLFERMYSTGTVTRGAQEAVWCGHVSSVNTAMMRTRPDVQAACIPDLLAEDRGRSWFSFWHHGGEGRFDGQVDFWRDHHVAEILSQVDFPNDAPRTGWGVSDRAMFIRSVQNLSMQVKTDPKRTYVGMVLSVTNHIPWKLPEDAPLELREKSVEHPSFKTAAFTDFSLGEYERGLKEHGLWEDTILIVSGDHGTTLPPYAKEVDQSVRDLQGHVAAFLSGGVVERVRRSADRASKSRIKEIVSQASLYSLMCEILGLKARAFYPPPFHNASVPVYVDLGPELFVPASQTVIQLKEQKVPQNGDAERAWIHYRLIRTGLTRRE